MAHRKPREGVADAFFVFKKRKGRDKEKRKVESRERMLWRRYGLVEADYQRLLQGQGNKCAICSTVMTLPHVDHDHATNKLRGLLCCNCNIGLGNFRDSIPRLLWAVDYLRRYA